MSLHRCLLSHRVNHNASAPAGARGALGPRRDTQTTAGSLAYAPGVDHSRRRIGTWPKLQLVWPGNPPSSAKGIGRWVRVSHWVVVLAFVTLAASGYLILMVHPRLYWGEAGNDLMPSLLELPISSNHQPERLKQTTSFTEIPGAPMSAYREFRQFNENGWARSLHFLAGWFLVATGLFYVLAGLVSGHVWRNLLPRVRELRRATEHRCGCASKPSSATRASNFSGASS